MAKKPILPVVDQQALQDAADQLNKIQAALDTSGLGSALEADKNIAGGTILASPPLMPTDTSLSRLQQEATSTMAAASVGKVGEVDASFAQTLGALQSAVQYTDKITTTPTVLSIGQGAMQMPASVRDTANGLYYYKTQAGPQYSRERADKILVALFGQDLGEKIILTAASLGSGAKPLVWVSQQLTYDINADKPHGYEALADLPSVTKYSVEYDEGPTSPVLSALYTCFEPLTVKNLGRAAKYHGISTLEVLRAMFKDILKEYGVSA